MQDVHSDSNLHGLKLVALVVAWLAGILLASLLFFPPLMLLICAGITVVLIILWRRDKQWQLSMYLLLLLFCGAWRYTIALPNNDPLSITNFIGTGTLTLQGVVADEPKVQTRTRLFILEVNSISNNGGTSWEDAHGQVEIQTLSTSIEDPYGANYGDSAKIQGKLLPPLPHTPPGIFAGMVFPRVTVTNSGGNPLLRFLYHLRVTLATMMSQLLPQPEAATFIAIVLGFRTPALKPLTQAFNVTGTAHLIVPSGFKVTILAGLAASSTQLFYTKRTGRQLPAAKRRDWRRWLTTVVVIASIAAYTVLSGAGSAALRAGIMGCILVIAPRLGRTYNVYTALAVTTLLLSLFDPFVLWDTGFQLSFLGTLGIVLLTPFFQHLLQPIERIPFGYLISEPVAVTMAAQVATLPIFAITFQQISFIAPIANILTVPCLGILILLGILISATGFIFMPLAVLWSWIAWPVLWYLDNRVAWCASLPGAFMVVNNLGSDVAWLYYILLAIMVTFLLKKWPPDPRPQLNHKTTATISTKTWRLIQGTVALLIIVTTGIAILTFPQNGPLTITFFDVAPAGQPSQGEAILIHTHEGRTVLIDGGLDATALGQALDSRLPPWQRSLDMVILTTARMDHIAGLQDVITRYAIGDVVDAGMLHPTTTYARWRRTISERNLHYVSVNQGMMIALGSQVVLQVLWPTLQLHASSNEARDNGLIIRLVAPGLHLLLLGAGAQSPYALAALDNASTATLLQAQIVQVVGEIGKPVPAELINMLQKIHPSLLIVTPSMLSATQRKAGSTSSIMAPVLYAATTSAWQTVQTAQVGTLEISSTATAWSVNIL